MINFNEIYKDFENNMNTLSQRYERARVFDDFLSLAICSFHQTNIQSRLTVKDPGNEKLYLNIIEKYDRNSIDIFPKLLGSLQMSTYNTPYSDLLGQYFTEHITRGQNGQYFTPNGICDLMTQITSPSEETGKRVLDPACGSGRLLLSFAKQAPDNFFYGADLSLTCAKMTTLNFFHNGLRGEVACMNTLSYEWFASWRINMHGIGILPIEKEQSEIWTKPKPTEPKPKKKKEQLDLFWF